MELFRLLQRIRNLSDHELVDLLMHREQYEPEAGEAAEAEFLRRNIPFEVLVEAQETATERERRREARKADLLTLEAWYNQLLDWIKSKLNLPLGD